MEQILKNCAQVKYGKCLSPVNPQPLENFRIDNQSSDGHKDNCKLCASALDKFNRNNPGQKEQEARRLFDLGLKMCSRAKSGACASETNPQPLINFRKDLQATLGVKSLCKTCESIDQKRKRERKRAERLATKIYVEKKTEDVSDKKINGGGFIYKITNKIDGKIYVGKTVESLRSRWKRHVYEAIKEESSRYFLRSIRKHGPENFKVEAICEVPDASNLAKMEQFWIASLNSMAPNGYNLTEGGDGLNGYSHTEETKAILAKKATGRIQTEETKSKLKEISTGNQHALGHFVSESARDKMSLANIGSVHTEEHKAKVRKALTGLKRTEETKARIAVAKIGNENGKGNLGVKRSEEAVANIRAGVQKRLANPNAGRAYGKRSEESKQRMRESALRRKRVYTDEECAEIGRKTKERWAKRTEEERKAIAEKIAAANTGTIRSEETKQLMSEIKKATLLKKE